MRIRPGLSAEPISFLGKMTISSFLLGKSVSRYFPVKTNVLDRVSFSIKSLSIGLMVQTTSSTKLFLEFFRDWDLKFDINNPNESGLTSPVFSNLSMSRPPLLKKASLFFFCYTLGFEIFNYCRK